MIMQPCIPNACDNSPTVFGVGASASPIFDELVFEPNIDALDGLSCPEKPSDDQHSPLILRIVGFGGWSYQLSIDFGVSYYYAQPRKNANGDCIGVYWYREEAGTVSASGVLQTKVGDFACNEEGEFSKDVTLQLNGGYLTIGGGEFDASYIKQMFPESQTKGIVVQVKTVKMTSMC